MNKIVVRISRASDRYFDIEVTENTAGVPTLQTTTDCSKYAMSKIDFHSSLNPQLLTVNHTSFSLFLLHQQMHTKYYKMNIKIKIVPACFGVIKPSSRSFRFVSAEVMNY